MGVGIVNISSTIENIIEYTLFSHFHVKSNSHHEFEESKAGFQEVDGLKRKGKYKYNLKIKKVK